MPILHLLAGPNGAGKSTLATRVLIPATRLPFVNADVIAADRWPDAQAEHAYEASALAAARRTELLEERRSFITETVHSHASKTALVVDARRRGYLVHLHVVMVPLATSLERVPFRVRRGGHDVPAEKIRERYERLWPLVVASARESDRATFYDNSSASAPFREVAVFEHGEAMRAPAWPRWAHPALGRWSRD